MKTARKILCLVTSVAATASIASADPAKPPAHWSGARGVTAVVLDGSPYLISKDTAPAPMSWTEYGRFLGETQPLVGPDGRPGCGNTLNKGPSRCVPARQAALAARIEATQRDRAAAATEASRDLETKQWIAQAAQAAEQARKGKAQ